MNRLGGPPWTDDWVWDVDVSGLSIRSHPKSCRSYSISSRIIHDLGGSIQYSAKLFKVL